MIRGFVASDLRRLKSNDFSKFEDVKFIFYEDTFHKFTLVDKDEIYAIIVFHRYWKNNFAAFFLISEDMPSICARELKAFVDGAIIDFKADRVQTESVDTEKLNRWHEFLGFTLEGKREKMIFNNNYCLWGKLKGRDF